MQNSSASFWREVRALCSASARAVPAARDFTLHQACHYLTVYRMESELGKSAVEAMASVASKSSTTEVLSKEEALRRFKARKAAQDAAAHPVTETPEQLAAKQETLNQLIAKQGLKRNAALDRFIARKGLKVEGSAPS